MTLKQNSTQNYTDNKRNVTHNEYKEDGGFFCFIDDSVSLLGCGVVASEAKLVHGDDVVNRYCSF
jgi:hypothetical protein